MYRSNFALLIVPITFLTLSTSAFAGDPSTWIPMSQAVQAAQSTLPAATPIKAELVLGTTSAAYEVKTFSGNTLYELTVDPDAGSVIEIDPNNGGGAQDKIAEAQAVISHSSYTLAQAINLADSLYPNSFLIEIEMEMRNGVAIFDLDLARGPYRIDVRIRASDGVVIRERNLLVASSSPYRNLYVPDAGPDWNVSTLKAAPQIVTSTKQHFGGTPFDIELNQVTTNVFRYEVRLLKDNHVIKAKYNAKTGALISSSNIFNAQYVAQVQSSVSQSVLTLNQAIWKARTLVPGGVVIEAQLKLEQQGRFYEVKFLTNAGIVEVKVNSETGGINSIQYKD